MAFYWSGRANDAIAMCDSALRLSPRDQQSWAFYHVRGCSYFFLARYEEAIADAIASIQKTTDQIFAHILLACCQANLGKTDEAKATLDNARRGEPGLSLKFLAANLNHLHPPYLEKYLSDLRRLDVISHEVVHSILF